MIMLASLEVKQEQDVVSARQLARRIARLLGFDEQDQTRIATALSELARNALTYGIEGRVEFSLETESPQALRIRVSDRGPGLPDDLSTTTTGMGLTSARRLMDSFKVTSGTAEGTIIEISKFRHGLETLSHAAVTDITGQLEQTKPVSPFEEVTRQNRELLKVLSSLEASRQELLRLNQELEDTNRGVVALYAELDEKAKELHRANELKSHFLAYMSHEFRTPLNSILALTRLLIERVDGDLSTEQEKQATLIRSAAGELLEMVNDLLDLAKVESGIIEVYDETLEVADLFSTLRGMFLPLFNQSGVNLTFGTTKELPSLRTDEGKLNQILRNFISNALKFTPEGSVSVTASVAPESGEIIFRVADTGIGIAPEDQARIFQEFGQVNSPLQRRSSGTGLGLAISRKMAEVLGGYVTLDSTPGKGSVFSLVLPLKTAPSLSPVQEPQVRTQQAQPVDDFPATPVLIVDNDEVDRYILKEVLAGLPLVIHEAAGGHAGLKLLQENVIELVFLDLAMPEMDGFEVLGALRTQEATRELPVIVVTSKSLTAKESAYLQEHATAVLSKSKFSDEDTTQQARACVMNVLATRNQRRQAGNAS